MQRQREQEEAFTAALAAAAAPAADAPGGGSGVGGSAAPPAAASAGKSHALTRTLSVGVQRAGSAADELAALPMAKLRRIALAQGVCPDAIDETYDSPDPKHALVAAILAHTGIPSAGRAAVGAPAPAPAPIAPVRGAERAVAASSNAGARRSGRESPAGAGRDTDDAGTGRFRPVVAAPGAQSLAPAAVDSDGGSGQVQAGHRPALKPQRGRLRVAGGQASSIQYITGAFGAQWVGGGNRGDTGSAQMRFVRVEPPRAEFEIVNDSAVSGAVAVVEAGGGTAVEVAERAARAGAAGLILIGQADRLAAPVAAVEEAARAAAIGIPVRPGRLFCHRSTALLGRRGGNSRADEPTAAAQVVAVKHSAGMALSRRGTFSLAPAERPRRNPASSARRRPGKSTRQVSRPLALWASRARPVVMPCTITRGLMGMARSAGARAVGGTSSFEHGRR